MADVFIPAACQWRVLLQPKQIDWLVCTYCCLFLKQLSLLHSNAALWQWQSLSCLLAHHLILTGWILICSHYCKGVFGAESEGRFCLSLFILSLQSRWSSLTFMKQIYKAHYYSHLPNDWAWKQMHQFTTHGNCTYLHSIHGFSSSLVY